MKGVTLMGLPGVTLPMIIFLAVGWIIDKAISSNKEKD